MPSRSRTTARVHSGGWKRSSPTRQVARRHVRPRVEREGLAASACRTGRGPAPARARPARAAASARKVAISSPSRSGVAGVGPPLTRGLAGTRHHRGDEHQQLGRPRGPRPACAVKPPSECATTTTWSRSPIASTTVCGVLGSSPAESSSHGRSTATTSWPRPSKPAAATSSQLAAWSAAPWIRTNVMRPRRTARRGRASARGRAARLRPKPGPRTGGRPGPPTMRGHAPARPPPGRPTWYPPVSAKPGRVLGGGQALGARATTRWRSTASPSAAPICAVVFTRPEASPASSGVAPDMATRHQRRAIADARLPAPSSADRWAGRAARSSRRPGRARTGPGRRRSGRGPEPAVVLAPKRVISDSV